MSLMTAAASSSQPAIAGPSAVRSIRAPRAIASGFRAASAMLSVFREWPPTGGPRSGPSRKPETGCAQQVFKGRSAIACNDRETGWRRSNRRVQVLVAFGRPGPVRFMDFSASNLGRTWEVLVGLGSLDLGGFGQKEPLFSGEKNVKNTLNNGAYLDRNLQ
mgnify:CR=1 FL=1